MKKIPTLRPWHYRVFALILLGLFPFYCLNRKVLDPVDVKRKCFLHNGRIPNGADKLISYFDDLLESVKQPDYDKAIFFIEAKCSESGIADLRPRYQRIIYSHKSFSVNNKYIFRPDLPVRLNRQPKQIRIVTFS